MDYKKDCSYVIVLFSFTPIFYIPFPLETSFEEYDTITAFTISFVTDDKSIVYKYNGMLL